MNKNSPQAQEIALRLLARRDHSRLELLQKLLIRKIPSPEADDALRRLAAQGLLDDERYARRLAHHLSGDKLLGPRRIREKLSLKGISRDLLAEIEKETGRETPPDERLRKLAQIKLKRRALHELGPREQRKIAQFFYQRGFSWNDIREFFHKAGGWFEE